MNDSELVEICQNCRFQVFEPGETVYKQGDHGEHYYIVLKGRIQVSIPDPLSDGIIEPKEAVVEEALDESVLPVE